jgi:hypothetical protein
LAHNTIYLGLAPIGGGKDLLLDYIYVYADYSVVGGIDGSYGG